MRPLIALILLLTFQVCNSQALDIFQNDSIYSKNKISARTMYSINGSTLQKELMTNYNSAGQKIKQFWYWNGETDFHNVENFYYSNNGLITSLIDSFADGNIETTSYYYKNNVPEKQVTLNQNNDTTDFRSYPHKSTTIQRWYEDGKPYRYDTTTFEKENIMLEYCGTDSARNQGKFFTWHYKFLNQFDSNGNLMKVSSKVERPYSSFTRYFYDNRNLLIKKQEVFFIKKKEEIQTEYYFTYE